MIEKLNLREVENGAHGAQSTVVEGASLSVHLISISEFRLIFLNMALFTDNFITDLHLLL